MKKRILGRTGIEVSDICLGCWAIGGPFSDLKGTMGYGTVDDAESRAALRRALDLGVTFFDTANVYGCGHSERLLGEVIGGRKDIVISDKFGFVFNESGRLVTGTDASPAFIHQSLEDSLRRLRREMIDIYGFHTWDYPIDQAHEVLATLDALVEEGKIRSYCWLTDDIPRVKFIAQGKHCAGAPQLLNVLEHNKALLALCEELGLPALARRPLGMGLLTGKFTPDSQFADNDMRKRFGWDFHKGKQARQVQKLEAIRAVLTRDGRTLTQGALGWVWGCSPQALPSPGFENVRQVEENVGAVQFGPLSPEQMREIETILASA